jgi:hypothetical protein
MLARTTRQMEISRHPVVASEDVHIHIRARADTQTHPYLRWLDVRLIDRNIASVLLIRVPRALRRSIIVSTYYIGSLSITCARPLIICPSALSILIPPMFV